MKYIFSLILLFSAVATQAANFTAANFLSGTNLTLYSAVTATTWKYDDSYATNRRYVAKPYTLDTNGAIVITTTVIPKATNSVSGALVPSFETPVKVWSDANGQNPTNCVITFLGSTTASVTNATTLTFTFVKSTDGGNTYSTTDPNGLFTFVWDGSDATGTVALTTNVPPSFLCGASHVRLWKVVSGANAANAYGVTSGKILFSGYTP